MINATATIPTSTVTHGDPTSGTQRPVLWRAGVAAGALAALATTVVAAIARAADVPLAVKGEQIPVAGFAQLTLFATVIGVVLGRVLSKRARRPRHTFTVVALALTAASLVPDAIVDATAGSKAVLMLTHLVAAAIVIPTLAKRVGQ
jgi:peptidoglycan/LPS O-acetylase OafA/YrhL